MTIALGGDNANTKHLIKYSAPTTWDKAPYMTIWRIKDPQGDDIRIQMSQDKSRPCWMPLPEILVRSFDKFYEDNEFVEDVITLYQSETGGTVVDEKKLNFMKNKYSMAAGRGM